MNKTELIAAVAEKAGISKKDADNSVNAVLDVIVETLASDEKVQLVGILVRLKCAAQCKTGP